MKPTFYGGIIIFSIWRIHYLDIQHDNIFVLINEIYCEFLHAAKYELSNF